MDDARQKRHTTLVSALATCAAAAAFFAFFPDVSPELKDPKEPQTLASISTDGEGFFGLDEIADFAPLFLPTRRNASAAPRKIPQPAGWDFGKSDSDTPAAALRSPEFLPNAESDMARGRSAFMRAVMRNFFSSYGRANLDIPQSDGSATFKLVDLNTGETVRTAPVKLKSPNKMYAVAEFKVYIERDGWAMKPLELQSSGDERNDAELASMLTSAKLLKGAEKGEYRAVFIP